MLRVLVMTTVRALVAVGAVVTIALAPLASAVPVHAAQGNLEVSSDIVNFSKTFTGALFEGIHSLVPGDVQEKRIYLRNSGDASGFLRITLEDVQYDDLYLANALTIRTVVNSVPEQETAISIAQPCWVLTEGQRVEPGQIVAVDTELALGNLDGQQGMGGNAGFSLAISLSDAMPGSLPPTECGQGGFSIPAVPRTNRGSDVSDQTAQVAAPATPRDSLGNNGGGNLPVLNLPGGIVIDPNTWDLLEELFILLLVASFVGGGAWFVIAARRRRDDSSDESEGVA